MIILRFKNFVVPTSHILVAIEVTVYEYTNNNINSITLIFSYELLWSWCLFKAKET